MKRLFKILLFLILAVAAAVALFFIFHTDPRAAVEAYKKQLRAQGEKLTFVELAPSPSTNTPNLAWDFTNSPSLPTNSVTMPPAMTMVAPGIAIVGHADKSLLPFYDSEQNMSNSAELRAILDRTAVLDFNLDYSRGIFLILPHLSPLNRAQMLFSVTAVESLALQDNVAALSNLCAGADLIRLSCNEPDMISSLERAHMMSLAVKANWEALQDNDWTDSQLAQLQEEWEGVNLFDSQDAVMKMEIARAIESMAFARMDTNEPDTSVPAASTDDGASGGGVDGLKAQGRQLYEDYRYRRWKTSWSYEEELYNIQNAAAALKAARQIRTTGMFAPAMKDLKQQFDSIEALHPDAPRRFMLYYGHGVFDKFFTKIACAESTRRLLVTAIALKRYQLQHTNYPAALTDLVPAQLAQVPLDFMDGKPLRYRLNPDRTFLLYSVGDDGEDNGGDPSIVGTSTNLNNWVVARDIVWPRAARPGEFPPGTNAPVK